jgi:hypothetical protein
MCGESWVAKVDRHDDHQSKRVEDKPQTKTGYDSHEFIIASRPAPTFSDEAKFKHLEPGAHRRPDQAAPAPLV